MLAKCCGLIFGKSRFVWFGYEYLNGVRNYIVATSSDGENWTDFAPLKDENGEDLTTELKAMIVMP